MLARLAIAAVAVVLAGVLVVRLSDHQACEDARRGVFAVVAGNAPRGELGSDVRQVEEHCRGTDALVATAGALRTIGDTRRALALAREAADDEPESFAAWRAVAALSRGTERLEAERRARELNPGWRPAEAPAPAAPQVPAA
jgi:hypothetical protein